MVAKKISAEDKKLLNAHKEEQIRLKNFKDKKDLNKHMAIMRAGMIFKNMNFDESHQYALQKAPPIKKKKKLKGDHKKRSKTADLKA